MSNQGVAIFGGSFDPIHRGHVQTAIDVQSFFQFEKIIFMPCGQPVFKSKTHASNSQRLDMLRLAINQQKNFEIDEREILRHGPSFTVETLEELRKDYPYNPLVWIMGEDAFANILQWHRHQELLLLANLLVLARPLTQKIQIKTILEQYQTSNPKDLKSFQHGKIYIYQHSNYPYSSTQIRNAIANHQTPIGLDLMVENYIQKNKLYR